MGDDIIASWEENAKEWISVIEQNQIESRKFTNKAIINQIKDSKANSIIDIGCGEGWLVREISKMGKEGVGIDAIKTLLETAKEKGHESYFQMTYEDIIKGKLIPQAPYDMAVYNFCLYLKEGLEELLNNTLKALASNGVVIIQTLHPYFLLSNNLPYESQWLNDSWKGLPGSFVNGHKWYARTLDDWLAELNKLANTTTEITEVVNTEKKPVSLILKIQKNK
ncbi:hypothetical protein MTsPCn9_02070 [Croceitalea sp. MTPC9]|uniref:class I SAM-dependent methyltransferase n=1 Tax=unclassified Croceitalea TaxID=2632280 RepID=UPI002B3666DB|nr:hypothetical protein MTsPCn6_06640 [Croceitalea sp. MTPC6]GMN15271.1 hypothetical protein MTsPCn9_02070 [Croceitalea sp. MTPC9]